MEVFIDDTLQSESVIKSFTCVKPPDYYSNRCPSCTSRNPNYNREYWRIKYTPKKKNENDL